MSSFIDEMIGWDFRALFHDFSWAKSGKCQGTITPYQENILCGLALKNKPQKIAERIQVSDSTVRKNLSSSFYPIINRIPGFEKISKITWDIISDTLINLGYKFPDLDIIKDADLFYISSFLHKKPYNNIRKPQVIISSIKRQDQTINDQFLDASKIKLENLIKKADELIDLVKSGEDSQNYSRAVDLYYEALLSKALSFEDPLLKYKLLKKIARCYDKTGSLDYSLVICDYLLKIIDDDHSKEKSNVFLLAGGALHDITVKQESFSMRNTDLTIQFYDQAHNFDVNNCLPLWNKFEFYASLINKINLTERDKESFHQKAEYVFDSFIHKSRKKDTEFTSNFRKNRDKILVDAYQSLIGDRWMEHLTTLESL